MTKTHGINQSDASLRQAWLRLGIRLLLCGVVAMAPFLSAPLQAAQHSELSVHASIPHHMSQGVAVDHTNHDMHGMVHDDQGDEDCCKLSALCIHDQCSMNSLHVFGAIKPAETYFSSPIKLSWSHDIILQSDGQRPLLNPPNS